MTTTRQIIETVRDALLNDAALNTWAQETYGKALTVLAGVDRPLDDELYPVAAIMEITKNRAVGAGTLGWIISLGAGIMREAVTAAGNGRTVEGFIEAEELREQCEDALERARFAKLSFDAESAQMSYHPFYISFIQLGVEMINPRLRRK